MEELKKENETLKEEIRMLKEHLSRYTNPHRYKAYYEANREKIIKQKMEYQKEYYKKRKEMRLKN